jgi:hypothetical protein
MASIILKEGIGTQDDLTTATTSAKYPLGKVIEVHNTTDNVIDKYMYVQAHAALTAKAAYMVVGIGTAGSEWKTAAPAALIGAVAQAAVPQVAITSDYFGWVKIQGKTTGTLVSTTGLAANTYVSLLGGATTWDSEGTTYTIGSAAVVVSATTSTAATLNLLGGRCEVSS